MYLLWLACADPEPPGPAGDTDTAEEVLRGALAFSFPLEDRTAFEQVMGVDHDPVDYEGIEELYCSNYAGEPWPNCYDEHDGTDYLLEGTWDAMEAGSVWILAAADGVVVDTHDGEYDHCHGDLTTMDVSCDGNPMVANQVTLEHEGGWRTLYWHMMTDSVAVSIGDKVRCGDRLGVVGSSGYSSQPHLHFELQDAAGNPIDPYAGELSQPETWWQDQGSDGDLPASVCGE